MGMGMREIRNRIIQVGSRDGQVSVRITDMDHHPTPDSMILWFTIDKAKEVIRCLTDVVEAATQEERSAHASH